jgi:hypothetical protein
VKRPRHAIFTDQYNFLTDTFPAPSRTPVHLAILAHNCFSLCDAPETRE